MATICINDVIKYNSFQNLIPSLFSLRFTKSNTARVAMLDAQAIYGLYADMRNTETSGILNPQSKTIQELNFGFQLCYIQKEL